MKDSPLTTRSSLIMTQTSPYIPLPVSAHDAEDSPTQDDETNDTTPLVSFSDSGPQTTRPGLVIYADSSYTYSYGPAGLAGLWHNYYAFLCAIFASIGGLTFGYDQGVVCAHLVTIYEFFLLLLDREYLGNEGLCRAVASDSAAERRSE